MVWFYLVATYVRLEVVENFQSHYGLILSQKKVNEHEFSILVKATLSIPLWSDFIVINVYESEPTHFQSHYGLILSHFEA